MLGLWRNVYVSSAGNKANLFYRNCETSVSQTYCGNPAVPALNGIQFSVARYKNTLNTDAGNALVLLGWPN